MPMAAPAKEIDAYLAQLAPEMRAALEGVRKSVRAAAPSAVETISYGMPAFKYQGRPLAYVAAFTKHCSFFPASTEVIDAHAADLASYSLSKGTIRFPPGKPLPAALVRKLIKARIAEIDANVSARAAKRRRAR